MFCRPSAAHRHQYSAVLILGLLTGLLLISCSAPPEMDSGDDSVTPDEVTAEDIAVAFHGLALDADGRLLRDVPPQALAAYHQRNNQNLAELAHTAPLMDIDRDGTADDEEEEVPVDEEEPPEVAEPPPAPPPPAPPPRRMSAYMRDCDRNKVPLPPPWGDPAWQRQGVLPPDLTFAGQAGQTTEVWAYNDPGGKGVCMALPRKNAAGEIELLGIICQSKETGKACFWDNIDAATGNRITGAATAGMDPADIEDGSSLSENCTGCHRGDNAFVIHPDTPLELPAPFDIDPDQPYTPVSGTPPRPGWVNPPSPLPLAGTQCTMCHDMPQLTAAYCRTVLKKALEKTMPPEDTTTNPATPAGTWDPDYRGDVTKLAKKCKDDFGVDLGVP